MNDEAVPWFKAIISVTVVSILALSSGCAESAENPRPTDLVSLAPSPTPTPAEDPELVLGGTAGQNRPYVEFVMDRLIAISPEMTSLEIADTLVAAGFERTSLQVSEYATRVGSRADSILFSILVDGECLLGQVADGAVTTSIGDVLGTGKCLVGRTASLD
jgi:hypothetical protein